MASNLLAMATIPSGLFLRVRVRGQLDSANSALGIKLADMQRPGLYPKGGQSLGAAGYQGEPGPKKDWKSCPSRPHKFPRRFYQVPPLPLSLSLSFSFQLSTVRGLAY